MTNQTKSDGTPTWDTIKTYFTAGDISCMLGVSNGAINLGDCSSVSANAAAIYGQVSTGQMPKGGPPWSAAWVSNFKTWMDAGAKCP